MSSPNHQYLWAAIAEEPDGRDAEGICGFYTPGVGNTPLIAFQERNVGMIREVARKLSVASGKKINIVKFIRVEDE